MTGPERGNLSSFSPALRQHFGVANFHRPDFEVVSDILKILRRSAKRFFQVRLMHHLCQLPRAVRLFPVVAGLVHTRTTPV
jgi:hypothetical protein